MDYIEQPYIVYVQTDEAGRITAVNSSAFVDLDWGTEIDQGFGDQYHHAQGNYFPKPIYTEDGIPGTSWWMARPWSVRRRRFLPTGRPGRSRSPPCRSKWGRRSGWPKRRPRT